jgi:hypothetical protein
LGMRIFSFFAWAPLASNERGELRILLIIGLAWLVRLNL